MAKNTLFYFKRIWEMTLALLCLPLARHPFRSRKLIVVGAWFGELYADNPKHFAEYLIEHSRLKVVWIGKPAVKAHLPSHPAISFARKGSFKAFCVLLRAGTWVCCQSVQADLTPLPIAGNAICVNLWHGIPVKKVGAVTPKAIRRVGQSKRSLSDRIYEFVFCRLGRKSEYLLVSSDRMADILVEGNRTRFSYRAVLPFGTPRNDFLVHNAENEVLISKLKEKYSKLLGFDPSLKLVSYLPTFRMDGGEVFSFYSLPKKRQVEIAKLLAENDAVLVEQHHYMTYRHTPPRASSCSVLVIPDMKPFVDTQELLLITDVLVSDYSGAFIDFSLLKRPCIHFAYDLEHYKEADSGMAYDIRQVAAGPIVEDAKTLVKAIEAALSNPVFAPAPRCHELTAFENGHSCEQLLNFIACVNSKGIQSQQTISPEKPEHHF